MATSYTTRTIPTTSYNFTRLGGGYLLDWNGDQVLDSDGNPIITIVLWGQIPFTTYSTRVQPLLYDYFEVSTWVKLQINSTDYLEIKAAEVWVLYTTRTIP